MSIDLKFNNKLNITQRIRNIFINYAIFALLSNDSPNLGSIEK